MNAMIANVDELSVGGRLCVGPLAPSNCHLPLPAHEIYVETRGSYGAWLFHKARSKVEVLNDDDGDALNLSRLLMRESERSEMATAYARAGVGDVEVGSPIYRAVRFASSVEGAMRTVGPLPKTLRAAPPLMAGLNRLDRVLDRLRGVQVESGTTAKLFERFDCMRAFFLCDERGRAWVEAEGQKLIGVMEGAKGKVMLISDGAPDWLGSRVSWRRLPLNARDAAPMSCAETVWVNY